MQNTGSVPWVINYTSQDTGTPTGTCAPGSDQPPSSTSKFGGLGKTPPSTQCSVPVTLTSKNYFLAHAASSFSADPEKASLVYTGVTKTTTYTPEHTITDTYPCGGGLFQQAPINDNNIFHLIKTAFAIAQKPGTCTETDIIPELWSVSYSGGGYRSAIGAGGTAAFTFNSLTAPSANGSYTESWQMQQDGNPFGSPVTVPITVGSGVPQPPAANGIVHVTSENSKTHDLVTSAWDVVTTNAATTTFPCDSTKPGSYGVNTSPCTGSARTFNNIATDDNMITVYAHPDSAGSGLSLRGVEKQTPHIVAVGNENNLFVAIAEFGKGIISPNALAAEVCGQLGSTPPSSCPLGSEVPTTTLTPGQPEASYIIVWDPIAAMSLDTNSWSPTADKDGSAVTQAVKVGNGGKPGSTLTWTATPNTKSGGNWLSVSPATDATGVAQGGTPDSVTLTADPSGLAAGTYSGTVTFNGSSTPGVDPFGTKIGASVSVTLTVTGPSAPTFACGSGVCATTASPSGASSCSNACGWSSSASPVATCTPSLVTLSPLTTSQCVVSVGGVNQSNATWQVVSGSNGSITPSGVFTPSAAGTESVQGTLPDGTSATATVTVNALPTCAPGDPACQAKCSTSLTASPSSIVVPESATLSYSCSNVTDCALSGGQFGTGTPMAASVTVTSTPSITTTYTLTCVNKPYGNTDSVQSSATVTVGGSSRCEQNPNGAGCPGH
jgi:hypothetical protein